MTTERIKQSLFEEAQRNLGLSKLAAAELQKGFLSKAQELQAAIEIIEQNYLEGQLMKEITNPVKAIRAKCLDCCCGQANEVTLCPSADCALYPFRMGKNPYRQKTSREYTPEQRAAARARMYRLHEARKHD